MCIVIATTAHPSYSLILINNRDEFILRPTSQPHWWSLREQTVLSSRDLQRSEQGTWLGLTKSGKFAVLTNFRESISQDVEHPIHGVKSRGGMVTAWLNTSEDENIGQFVHKILETGEVKGVGGFSLVCGTLRPKAGSKNELEPLAIISNRSAHPEDVPWIAGKRNEVYGLSNTFYDDPVRWEKVERGKEKILEVVETAVAENFGEDELVEKLFSILDIDTLPKQNGEDFMSYTYQLRKSIFIPAVYEESPDSTGIVVKNAYGTQRQTILLVDLNGKVTYRERALWDAEGNAVERGKGDTEFEFQIEGWPVENGVDAVA